MKRSGFTLVEMVVCLTILAILAVLLIPAANHAIKASRAAGCMANLRQIGVGMAGYAAENDNRFPHAFDPDKGDNVTWMRKVAPYLGMPDDAMGSYPLPRATGVFVCPEWTMKADRAVSYAMNASIDPKYSFKTWDYRRLTVESQTFLVVEIAKNQELYSPASDGEVARRHPPDAANFLFVDGHVEAISEAVPRDDPRWFRQ